MRRCGHPDTSHVLQLPLTCAALSPAARSPGGTAPQWSDARLKWWRIDSAREAPAPRVAS